MGNLRVSAGEDSCAKHGFDLSDSQSARIVIAVANARLGLGAQATRVMIDAGSASFAFFLRNVSSKTPIRLPEFEVAVVPSSDERAYADVAGALKSLGKPGAM